MTKRDYVWLAQILAVVMHRFVGLGVQVDVYDYVVGQLSMKYPRFNEQKFEKEFKKQYELLEPRCTG